MNEHERETEVSIIGDDHSNDNQIGASERKWWERLIFDSPQNNTVVCPVCQEEIQKLLASVSAPNYETVLEWTREFPEFFSDTLKVSNDKMQVYTTDNVRILDVISTLRNENKSYEHIRENLLRDAFRERAISHEIQFEIAEPQKSSIEVACSNDDTLLPIVSFSKWRQWFIVNTLRLLMIGTAAAVGYLNWIWPSYVFGGLIIITFFALFLRRHPTNLRFFIVVSILGFIGQGIWRIADPQTSSFPHITALIIMVSLILSPLFLLLYTLRSNQDPVQTWIANHYIPLPSRRLLWIAFMLGTTIVCLVVAMLLRVAFPTTFAEYNTYILRLALFAFGSAEIAALVSSLVFTLRGEPFHVPDKWKFKPVMRERTFPRIANPPTIEPRSWSADRRFSKILNQFSKNITRMANSLNRSRVSSMNQIIVSLEHTYNRIVVRSINNLVHFLIRVANSIRRSIIKTARHLVRSTKHLIIVNKWAVIWVLRINKNYSRVFFVAPLLIWLSAARLYDTSIDFFVYVHGGQWFLPIWIFLQIIVIFGFMVLATKQLLRTAYDTFADKVLNAVTIIGPNAFLTFVVTSLLLGATERLFPGGPYRIGWVTILSTMLIIGVFLYALLSPRPSEE